MDQDGNHELELKVAAPKGAGAPCLSKSKYLGGLQCPKLLWHAYNAKDKIPLPNAQTQAVFDQGQEVGSLAKQMFPGGVEVGAGATDHDDIIRLTKQALKLRTPLFTDRKLLFGRPRLLGAARVSAVW